MKPHTPLKLTIVNRNNMAVVSRSVKETLQVAQEQGRLTCGVYESGKLLEMDPCGVMLCILPDNVGHDVTLQIHYTLIQAYCWENDIGLLKVDSCEKLGKVLNEGKTLHRPALDNSSATTCSDQDFNCVLIQYPLEDSTEAEEDVMEFCKMTCDQNPLPVVQLDV